MNIVDTAAGNPAFSTLVSAIKAANLGQALAANGPFTVFAPTNEAFAKLPAGTVEDLVLPANKDKLTKILKLHVVSGKHMASEFTGKTADIATLGGEKVTVTGKDGSVHVGKAKVSSADLNASNGVIHVIDTVMMPA
ncbi:MAG: fasciclin domain-containing protein [Tabrizicola sp.]|nr:fasciclin domain-containing protein [Tabrizicola sp.]